MSKNERELMAATLFREFGNWGVSWAEVRSREPWLAHADRLIESGYRRQPEPEREAREVTRATACQIPIWDGPYRMPCGYVIVNGRCVRHGKVPSTEETP